MHSSMFTSRYSEHQTPDNVLELVYEFFGTIDLDPASNPPPFNVRAQEHCYLPHGNGLDTPWNGSTVFLNPPYGRDIGKWIAKAITEPKEIVMLLPFRSDTKWFTPIQLLARIEIKGRLKFKGNTSSAPFPSVLVYKGPRIKEFIRIFSTLGVPINVCNN